MKFPFLKSDAFRRILVVGLLGTTVFPHAAQCQISALKKAVEATEPAKSPAPEKPEAIRARIDQWHQEAKEVLAKLDSPSANTILPEGVSAAELDDRRRGLDAMILISAQWLKNLDAAAAARKDSETARTEYASWTGFKEPPPYSILMVDELLNERDAIRAKLTAYESSLSNYERLLAGVLEETKVAEESVRALVVEVQKSGDAKTEAAKWRLEAARAKSRLLAARSGMFKSDCESLKDRIATAKSGIILLEKKVKAASANSRFSDEDMVTLRKISEERNQALRKESDVIAKRLKSAKIPRTQAQDALDALIASAPAGKEPEGLEMAKFRLEVSEGRIDALQSIAEWLEGLLQLEVINLEAYKDRRAILDARNTQERLDALGSLRRILDRIGAWENVLASEISGSEAGLGQLESRAASISAEDPRFSLLNEQRAIRSEKLTMIQRVSKTVGAQRKLVKRWIEEYSPKPGDAGMFPRVASLGATSWETLKKIWSFEVMSFEDKIVVDGQTITGNIPVTLGMLLRALLFFIIGYQIASRIVGRLQRTVVSRGHIAEAQARTLRNWLMIVVGIFLAIGTLSFLRIPLTVFAFFGGALAIGLGFGLQTLIKNFISGIIVLAERKVRVGDIVDVDGIVGTVVEVNTRSSIIRGADDVETMIPNSLFLENRVTNWTLSSSKMRRSLRVGVAYGTEPQKVMVILTESAARHGLICMHPEPFAVFEDFGDNALVFSLYFWIELGGSTSPMIIGSDLRLMIEKRFTEAGIGIPFPQRDMHLTTDKPIQVQISNPPQ